MTSLMLNASMLESGWVYSEVENIPGAFVQGHLLSLEPDDDTLYEMATMLIYRNVIDTYTARDLVILDIGEEHEIAFNEEGDGTALLHIDGEVS